MRISAGARQGEDVAVLVGGVTSHLAVSVAADGCGGAHKSLPHFLPHCSPGICGGCTEV